MPCVWRCLRGNPLPLRNLSSPPHPHALSWVHAPLSYGDMCVHPRVRGMVVSGARVNSSFYCCSSRYGLLRSRRWRSPRVTAHPSGWTSPGPALCPSNFFAGVPTASLMVMACLWCFNTVYSMVLISKWQRWVLSLCACCSPFLFCPYVSKCVGIFVQVIN